MILTVDLHFYGYLDIVLETQSAQLDNLLWNSLLYIECCLVFNILMHFIRILLLLNLLLNPWGKIFIIIRDIHKFEIIMSFLADRLYHDIHIADLE